MRTHQRPITDTLLFKLAQLLLPREWLLNLFGHRVPIPVTPRRRPRR